MNYIINVKIETAAPSDILFMRRTGPYGAENHALMESLKKWAAERELLGADSVILGIAQDDPAAVPPDKCRYDVCLINSAGYVPSEADVGINTGVLSGGKYMVLVISHTAEAVGKAWASIPAVLAEMGCIPDIGRPVMERYSGELVSKQLCELCVPIK